MLYKAGLLDLDGELVIVRMLSQADLPSAPNVLEVALESGVNLLDRALQIGIPLILSIQHTHD